MRGARQGTLYNTTRPSSETLANRMATSEIFSSLFLLGREGAHANSLYSGHCDTVVLTCFNGVGE